MRRYISFLHLAPHSFYHRYRFVFFSGLCAVVVGAGFFVYFLGIETGHNIQKRALDERALLYCLSLPKENQPPCLDDALSRIAEKKGIRAALDVLEPLSSRHSYLLEWSHPFAHTIGRSGLAYYSETSLPPESQIGRALVTCDGFGAFGCYHGVIEIGISRLDPRARATVIRKACMEDPLIQSKQYFVNQCLHWFGHSLAIFTNYSLNETLHACESLSPNFNSDEVQLCLSGVFHAGSVPGESDDSFLDNIDHVWRAGDPYFPCNEVEEKFRGHCYSHAAGRTRSSDLALGFQACDNIPEADPEKKLRYVYGCYDAQANTLLTQVLSNAEWSDEQKAEKIVLGCQKYARSEYRRFCYAGAARYWALRDPSLDNKNPFEICGRVERSAKNACYGNIGFGNNENYYSQEILEKYCQNSESEYVQACLSKAVRKVNSDGTSTWL